MNGLGYDLTTCMHDGTWSWTVDPCGSKWIQSVSPKYQGLYPFQREHWRGGRGEEAFEASYDNTPGKEESPHYTLHEKVPFTA